MKVSSANIPQADRLQNVISLILEIQAGAHTDTELIANIPSLNTPRQGRYYRNAAQILGFVHNHRNHAELTAAGRDLVRNPTLTNPLFMAAVLRIDVIQQLLPLLETKPSGVTRQQLLEYTMKVSAPVGPTVIPRRVNTIISWLRELGVIEERNGLIFLNQSFTAHLPVLEVPDLEQPLFPVTADLKEYKAVEERAVKAQEAIAYYKDAAKLERSNRAHQRLVNLVAGRISTAGGIAKTNALIDLATAVEEDFIFEMKSLGDTNIRAQIRKGLSQLYEYRYLQNKAVANLVLVLEKPLPRKEQWMIDYLEKDRDIHVIWDGDGQLYGTETSRKRLEFLKIV